MKNKAFRSRKDDGRASVLLANQIERQANKMAVRRERNDGDKTSKCGKKKKIHDEARAAKRMDGVMMGRYRINQLFARVGIQLAL